MKVIDYELAKYIVEWKASENEEREQVLRDMLECKLKGRKLTINLSARDLKRLDSISSITKEE